MEYLGIMAFIMAIMLLGLPKKVKKLDRKVRNLSNIVKGDSKMSKLLEELVGKKCAIHTEGIGPEGVILSVDEDWVKIQTENKKGKKKIILYPLDDVLSIEVLDD